mmetsp:Transcript_8906/g.24093  ORF Transcript_8906/g.24093 Transcript_8906/m.24093 type:complete len:146 (-) Transcript_8906:850-1287(-)
MAEENQTQPTRFFSPKYADPTFPIVKVDPSVDDVVKSLRFSDYVLMSSATVGSWVYGYVLGKPVRRPTAVTCATLGFSFGMLYTMQTVRNRLLGRLENDKEVKKWGLAPIQPLPEPHPIADRRFPSRQPLMSKEVRPNVDWDSYK